MSNRPVQRISYYCKTQKKAYDCAAVFLDDRHDWKRGIKSEREAQPDAKYPKILLSDAAARAERGEGYLSLVTPKGGEQASPEQRSGGNYDRASQSGGSDFSNDDLSF